MRSTGEARPAQSFRDCGPGFLRRLRRRGGEEPSALSRIGALTVEQATDLTIQFIADLAENCRVQVVYSELDAYLPPFLGSMLSFLDIPEARHAELRPFLEDKLDSLDGVEDSLDAKSDANFEVVARDDDSLCCTSETVRLSGRERTSCRDTAKAICGP